MASWTSGAWNHEDEDEVLMDMIDKVLLDGDEDLISLGLAMFYPL